MEMPENQDVSSALNSGACRTDTVSESSESNEQWRAQITTWSFADDSAMHFYVSMFCGERKFRIEQVLDAEGARLNSTWSKRCEIGCITEQFESLEAAKAAVYVAVRAVAGSVVSVKLPKEAIDARDASHRSTTGIVTLNRSGVSWEVSAVMEY
jgi:hypothetical protein